MSKSRSNRREALKHDRNGRDSTASLERYAAFRWELHWLAAARKAWPTSECCTRWNRRDCHSTSCQAPAPAETSSAGELHISDFSNFRSLFVTPRQELVFRIAIGVECLLTWLWMKGVSSHVTDAGRHYVFQFGAGVFLFFAVLIIAQATLTAVRHGPVLSYTVWLTPSTLSGAKRWLIALLGVVFFGVFGAIIIATSGTSRLALSTALSVWWLGVVVVIWALTDQLVRPH